MPSALRDHPVMPKLGFALLGLVGLSACSDRALSPMPRGGPTRSTADAVWTAGPSMSGARYDASGVTGPDGRIYVFGGRNFSAPITAEVFDPASEAWSTFADPGSFVRGVAGVGGDGRIYLIGNQSSGGVVYDASSQSFLSIAPMSTSRYAPSGATGADGRIYVFGGVTSSVPAAATSSGEVYDPATGAWSFTAPAPTPRFFAAAARAADGRIFVFGGSDLSTQLTTVEAYDPNTDSWATAAPMPLAWYAPAAVTATDGRIYVFGGVLPGAGPTTDVLVYDPTSNAWSAGPPLCTPRFSPVGVRGADGAIYAIGGADIAGAPMSSIEVLRNSGTSCALPPPNHPPTAVAGGPYSGTAGSPITFNAAGSSDPEGSALVFDWDFGDGATAANAGPSPSHTYSSAGSYTVTVTVHDDHAESDHASAPVSVVAPPPPAPTIETLAAKVQDLFASGAISSQTAGQLQASLNAAAASIASGNINAARGQIGAFINKAHAGIKTGKIGAADGAALIAFAQSINLS